jgi:hypothetical protein
MFMNHNPPRDLGAAWLRTRLCQEYAFRALSIWREIDYPFRNPCISSPKSGARPRLSGTLPHAEQSKGNKGEW